MKDPHPKKTLGILRSGGMRRRPTRHEQLLHDALCELQYQFKFQPFFYNNDTLYIPDFCLYTKAGRLVVEVDGPSHDKQKWYDERRTQWLAEFRNCTVLRFTNEEIESNIEKAILAIARHSPIKIGEELTKEEKRVAYKMKRDCSHRHRPELTKEEKCAKKEAKLAKRGKGKKTRKINGTGDQMMALPETMRW